MRNLMYKIGNELIASHSVAMARVKETGLDFEMVCTPFEEKRVITDEDRRKAKKRRDAIYARAHGSKSVMDN